MNIRVCSHRDWPLGNDSKLYCRSHMHNNKPPSKVVPTWFLCWFNRDSEQMKREHGMQKSIPKQITRKKYKTKKNDKWYKQWNPASYMNQGMSPTVTDDLRDGLYYINKNLLVTMLKHRCTSINECIFLNFML